MTRSSDKSSKRNGTITGTRQGSQTLCGEVNPRVAPVRMLPARTTRQPLWNSSKDEAGGRGDDQDYPTFEAPRD